VFVRRSVRVAVPTPAATAAFLNATGTTSWTLKLRHQLPRGSYVAISEAVDTAGRLERIDNSSRTRFQIT
jgi:hypothetical protein